MSGIPDSETRDRPAAAAEPVPIEIPFVEPYQTGDEIGLLGQTLSAVRPSENQVMLHRSLRLAGDNPQTRHCQAWLREQLGVDTALLTPSGTAALEMAALLAGLEPGDEVIMPSFTFSSTANAVVLRGAVPVFVDIRADTLNIDEGLVEAAITPRTRAIFVVHYAGVACEMDAINAIAARHGLLVLEDAAQALLSTYKGRPAGTLGDMAAVSFHETKNVHCGEGGAFLTNDRERGRRAEIVREKGTNRSAFFRGEIDKYVWLDIGSSYLPNEITAAFLLGQLRRAQPITQNRLAIWNRYHSAFAGIELAGLARRPIVPADCGHNAHIYYLLLPDAGRRVGFIRGLRERGIQATSHYVPLHSAPAGLRYGRTAGALPVTDRAANGLVRLPLWYGLGDRVDRVADAVTDVLRQLKESGS